MGKAWRCLSARITPPCRKTALAFGASMRTQSRPPFRTVPPVADVQQRLGRPVEPVERVARHRIAFWFARAHRHVGNGWRLCRPRRHRGHPGGHQRDVPPAGIDTHGCAIGRGGRRPGELKFVRQRGGRFARRRRIRSGRTRTENERRRKKEDAHGQPPHAGYWWKPSPQGQKSNMTM